MHDKELRKKIEELITKLDGSRKKVILYVINELSFLKSRDKMLQKLESNFEVFAENKDSVFVVLSVQPGTDDKLKLFSDDLIKQYKEILQKINKSVTILIAEG